jgi:hypothetical protein
LSHASRRARVSWRWASSLTLSLLQACFCLVDCFPALRRCGFPSFVSVSFRHVCRVFFFSPFSFLLPTRLRCMSVECFLCSKPLRQMPTAACVFYSLPFPYHLPTLVPSSMPRQYGRECVIAIMNRCIVQENTTLAEKELCVIQERKSPGQLPASSSSPPRAPCPPSHYSTMRVRQGHVVEWFNCDLRAGMSLPLADDWRQDPRVVRRIGGWKG